MVAVAARLTLTSHTSITVTMHITVDAMQPAATNATIGGWKSSMVRRTATNAIARLGIQLLSISCGVEWRR